MRTWTSLYDLMQAMWANDDDLEVMQNPARVLLA